MIIQPSYLHNGISHIGKMASFVLNHGPGHYEIGCGIKGQFAFHEEEFHPPAPPQCGEKKKFDGWPQNTIGHLFYATLSFLHHFVAIGEFKLELQSGNA